MNRFGQLIEVEKWKSKRLGASSQPSVTNRKHSTSFFAALADFILYMKHERQASPHTLKAYERDLLRFGAEREALKLNLDMEGITSEEIRAHMYGLFDQKLSRATVRRDIYALGSFFNWAVRWDVVRSNPVARITVPRRSRTREVRALNKRERAMLIAGADKLAANSRRVSAKQAPLVVRLLLKTGLRRAELLALTWNDLDVDRGELIVRHGKGDKSRRVPIEDKDLLGRLAAVRRARDIDKPGNNAALVAPIFVGTLSNKLSECSFYKLFHRILKLGDLLDRGITPHTLRHTFGTMLCAAGVPVPHVKDLLGHEDIGSTMIYVHSTPRELRLAVRKLTE